MIRRRSLLRRDSLHDDAIAGVVLGVESVPDGLAGGLLAGVNPVFGLYAYLVGTFTGALVTSSTFMAGETKGGEGNLIAGVKGGPNTGKTAGGVVPLLVPARVILISPRGL